MTSYIITHNIIDCEENRSRTTDEKKQYPFYFELYDDDKELYARGYSKDGDSEKAFRPLDDWMFDYGCTGIKYRNPTTKAMDWL